jgi:hypothetical protein
MRSFFLPALLAALSAACASAPAAPMSAQERLDRAQALATEWYTYSEVLALKLIDEYGAPDVIEAERLTWYNKGPWSKVAVWNDEDYYYSGTVGPDDLEQTLLYAVPREKRKDLAAFSDKLAVSKDGRQLSVRGNDEGRNYLTLNLAHEIIQGVRSPDDARAFYDRIYQLSESGKSSPYLQGLLFLRLPGDAAPAP